jgi:hypothetical protein
MAKTHQDRWPFYSDLGSLNQVVSTKLDSEDESCCLRSLQLVGSSLYEHLSLRFSPSSSANAIALNATKMTIDIKDMQAYIRHRNSN